MPKKGIFEKLWNSCLRFFSSPISNQFPIFSHSAPLAAAPLGPFSGPKKAGGEAHSCLFSGCQPCSQAGDRMSNLHIISSFQLPVFFFFKHLHTRSTGWGLLSFFSVGVHTVFFGGELKPLQKEANNINQLTRAVTHSAKCFTWSVNTEDRSHAVGPLYL